MTGRILFYTSKNLFNGIAICDGNILFYSACSTLVPLSLASSISLHQLSRPRLHGYIATKTNFVSRSILLRFRIHRLPAGFFICSVCQSLPDFDGIYPYGLLTGVMITLLIPFRQSQHLATIPYPSASSRPYDYITKHFGLETDR